ncbi:hypothetical protein FVE85_0728 [Porphyridium purpureum]|uniref:TLDc domain-containing protein n=1 Tax=Porphyridium purpureum TaxID=35688 RepID=A0A5J4YZD4_PORPP|nr:hypothetical protein FVE85_0728 [Porphyridium purpureum]|eukprot:POR4703..scf208_2
MCVCFVVVPTRVERRQQEAAHERAPVARAQTKWRLVHHSRSRAVVGKTRLGAEQQDAEEDLDVIERAMKWLGFKKEKTPFGLARFDRDKFPELWPAELEEQADPVEGDEKDPDLQLIRPMMARTSLQTRPMECVFDAEVHGWKAASFHRCVDKRGPAVVLARTKGGAVVGGYSPKGWVGYGESRGSIAAFLFTWPDGDTSKRSIKLRKIGMASMASMDQPESGPRFGAEGLTIPLLDARATEYDGTERVARCKLGTYYDKLPDGSKSLFAHGEGLLTELVSLRAFVGIYGSDEEIPFLDALPFSLE